MNTYTVSFFGHRQLDSPLSTEKLLEQLISDLLLNHEYMEFLIGRDGEFDYLATSAIRRCKRNIRSDNSSLIWVLPYLKAELTANQHSFQDYYDEIEVCQQSADSHYKAAYQTRNRAIVDRSDLIVFYVNHRSGGAYETMRYAIKQQKNILNIGTLKK